MHVRVPSGTHGAEGVPGRPGDDMEDSYPGGVDVDAYIAAHSAQWARLEELSRRRRLSRQESDELIDLYERAATHLSVVRSTCPDPDLVGYLSWLLLRGRSAAFVGGRAPFWAQVGPFFTRTFPAALYRLRWWWGTTTVVALLVAVTLGAWFLANPGFEAAVTDPETVRRLVEADFENYYSQHAASSFAAQVWTNNAWIAALCIAFGALGLPVVYLLWQNVLNVAFTGSIMIAHGRGALFFGLILPHGLLELTAVFVAAGVGLRLFWSWIEPGSRSRVASMAHAGRTSIAVVLGLVLVLAVSGVIEAFVTPSPLPTWARIGIGALAEVAFFAYVFGPGRAAARRGVSGDVTGLSAESAAPTAA